MSIYPRMEILSCTLIYSLAALQANLEDPFLEPPIPPNVGEDNHKRREANLRLILVFCF
jgi:hypothetical protein